MFEEPLNIFLIFGIITIVFFSLEHFAISGALGSFLLGVAMPNGTFSERIEKGLNGLKEISIGLFFFCFSFKAQGFLPDRFIMLLSLILMAFVLKPVSTYLGGIFYGLSLKARARAALSFSQRGEFSLIFVAFSPFLNSYVITTVFLTALVGSFTFAWAERVTRLIKKRPGSWRM